MHINKWTLSACGLAVGSALLPVMAADKPAQPNIVFILADDLGATDLGCTGSDLYQTPNIDGLAKQGMQFSTAFSSHPTCSPSRAAIMSGKYPARLGIVSHGARGTVVEGNGTFLPASEFTIAEALKEVGYTTCHIGKWHIGFDGDAGPKEQGFDVDLASNQFCCPGGYFYPYTNKREDAKRQAMNRVPGLEKYGKDRHLTENVADEAAGFIKSHKDGPFFLNLCFYAVHTPVQAKKEKVDKYKKMNRKGKRHKNPRYAALVEHLDDGVGTVLKAIDDAGIADNTIVIFFSDNGGANYSGITSNYPYREGKVTQYLGGTRVPMIVKWPGVTKAGSSCDTRVIGHDFYPTILDMANAPGNAKQNSEIDGKDLVPLLKEETTELDRDMLCWRRYPVIFHYKPGQHAMGPCATILKGDWKLMEFFDTPHGVEKSYELYNVKDDVSEEKNLADAMPEKVEELSKAMAGWCEDVKAPKYYEMAYDVYKTKDLTPKKKKKK